MVMLPLANSAVPMKPTANSTAPMMMVALTPTAFSICEPTTAPMQNSIIMMLNVSPTALFSSPNDWHMGAANIENA